jgi:hypothetical protein
MDGLLHSAQTWCTRCRLAPRLAGQRWCRVCLTQSQRQRRAARRAAQAEAAQGALDDSNTHRESAR